MLVKLQILRQKFWSRHNSVAVAPTTAARAPLQAMPRSRQLTDITKSVAAAADVARMESKKKVAHLEEKVRVPSRRSDCYALGAPYCGRGGGGGGGRGALGCVIVAWLGPSKVRIERSMCIYSVAHSNLRKHKLTTRCGTRRRYSFQRGHAMPCTGADVRRHVGAQKELLCPGRRLSGRSADGYGCRVLVPGFCLGRPGLFFEAMFCFRISVFARCQVR